MFKFKEIGKYEINRKNFNILNNYFENPNYEKKVEKKFYSSDDDEIDLKLDDLLQNLPLKIKEKTKLESETLTDIMGKIGSENIKITKVRGYNAEEINGTFYAIHEVIDLMLNDFWKEYNITSFSLKKKVNLLTGQRFYSINPISNNQEIGSIQGCAMLYDTAIQYRPFKRIINLF
jgi:hypothetical protein